MSGNTVVRIMTSPQGLLSRVLPFLVLCHLRSATSRSQSGDYCDTQVFRGECADGHVILMERALYGRMELGRCVTKDMGYIGCSVDVLQMADKRCSGRRVCEIRVPDAEFESVSECMVELKHYLTASYRCVEVESVTREHCEVHDEMNITKHHGYIANSVTSDIPECIGASHPWVLHAQKGQQINLTLFDFSVEDKTKGIYNVGEQTDVQNCQNYGIIEDSGRPNTKAICGGQTRRSQLYLSKGHVVRVWVTNDQGADFKRFVIEYSVIGCADPVVPDHGWFKRQNGKGIMGCRYGDITWQLKCEGHVWTGYHGNCSIKDSAHAKNTNGREDTSNEEVSMSMGIFIAIIVGAVFGLTLVLALVCIFRYRRRQNRRFPGNRESILLRQKTAAEYECKQTPVHQLTPVMNASPEVTHLTSDTEVNSKGQPPNSENSTPVCRHQHHHNVKVNGNDYEHIWEAPLPYPYGNATIKADITCSVHAKHHREPSYTTFKVDNRQKDSVRPMYITSMDLFPGKAKVKDPMTSPYETCRYSSLDRTKGIIRSNGCAKHQDLLL